MSASTSVKSVGARNAWIGIAILALVLVALNIALLRERHSGEQVEEARSSSVTDAKKLVPQILSYDYRRLDEDFAKAKASTTGRFAKEYATVVDGKLRKTAIAGKVVSKATITASSLVTANKDDAVVLLFVTQSTARAGANIPTISTSRIEVSLAQRDGEWLVSGITTV